MKRMSKILCVALSAIMLFGIFALAGCNKPLTVTFMSENTEFQKDKVKKGDKVKEPTKIPTKSGNDFIYWYRNTPAAANPYDFNMPVSEEFKLNAYFLPTGSERIEVTYNLDGGMGLGPVAVYTKDTAIQKPTNPTKTSNNFDGWTFVDENKDFTDQMFGTYVLTKNITLKAKWIPTGGGGGGTLVTNSGEFDGVFSPFFSTSAYDSAVAGQTQIAMLSSDKEGKVKVGEDDPCVVKDYTQKTFVRQTGGIIVEDTDGSKAPTSEAQRLDGNVYWTEYEFLIKNGIRFSDGQPLTIRDVLFNMYVYLDPMYTGSNTMYSTPIKGLVNYRYQNKEITEKDGSNLEATYVSKAMDRRDMIYNYFYNLGGDAIAKPHRQNFRKEKKGDPAEKKMANDVQQLRKEYWNELLSDWNSIENMDIAESFKEEGFTEAWEVFCYYNRMITVAREKDGSIKLKPGTNEKDINYSNTRELHHGKIDLISIVYNNMLGVLDHIEVGNYLSSDPNNKPRTDWNIRADGEIESSKYTLYDVDATGKITEESYTNTTKYLLARFLNDQLGALLVSNINYVAKYTPTGDSSFQVWINEAKSADFLLGGTRIVDKVDGISVYNTSTTDNKFNGVSLSAEHYVLKVAIVGVDPKAILNFGFVVAPMHYYSDPVGKPGGYSVSDGYTAFSYPGVPKADGTMPAANAPAHLGFKQLDPGYFKDIFKNETVLKVPVGAGSFMATDSQGRDNPAPTQFLSDSVVYFKRNPYFYTTGEGITNCKIQYLRYQVVDTSKVMDALISGTISYGDPSAKKENIDMVGSYSHLASEKVWNNGFGYVGINARFVPDINVRRAIMTAMNTSLILNYYVGGLAKIITRPMSTTSWAYPKPEPSDYYPFQNRAKALETVKNYIKDYKNGEKINPVNNEVMKLKFTFTIAGAETDHPAYQMFIDAADILNEAGFTVSVLPDPNALRKLSAGTLEVWAAAWGSGGNDPDMYQVYHKDSKAQSVNNWGYPYLIQQNNATDDEKRIINSLAKYIDDGRRTLDEDKRIKAYASALDLVMELAIEYPTYQRNNLYVYNKNVIVSETLNTDLSPYSGPLDRIWLVQLKNN